MKRWAALAALLLTAQARPASTAPAPPALKLWRLDCGSLDVDFTPFSDTGRYDGQRRTLTDSCYLVQHGRNYLLWDTGLPRRALGSPVREGGDSYVLQASLVDQLRRIGVGPAQIRYVGISHYHDDHTGQADDFAAATLLIGAGDWSVLNSAAGRRRWPGLFGSWRAGRARVETVEGDRDVFGDGSVTMLGLPGHTPGHHALLVRLPRTGAVLLSGDQFHARESLEHDQVPAFNKDRADTLASSARFREIAANLRARIIVQHEAGDIAKLPAFPAAAD